MTITKWIWPIIFLVGCMYFIVNYNVEDYFWEILIIVWLIFSYSTIRSYFLYKKGINNFQEILLDAKEKWDFLYQDIWVPFLIILLSMVFLLVSVDENSVAVYANVPILLKILFDKFILRNRLIVDENKMAYSKSGVFSEIEFRLVKGMIFDEDEGRVTINYEKIIPPKYGFLSTKVKTLDIDEIEETKTATKALERNGLFKEDWDAFKIILDQKSKEYDFGLSVIHPI